MSVEIAGKYQKITVINIHAPTEEKEIEIKEQFYNELDRIYERIAKYDLKVIIGDANVKLGREDQQVNVNRAYTNRSIQQT